MSRRLDIELQVLRQKGLGIEVKNQSVFVTVPLLRKEDVKKVIMLLGILKYRKSDLNVIGKDILRFLVSLLSKKYVLEMKLNIRWPFDAPVIFMEEYNVSQISYWSAEDNLYDIVRSFKRQYRDERENLKPRPRKSSDFIFIKKVQ